MAQGFPSSSLPSQGSSRNSGDRLIALFLAGLMVFNPPLLRAFGHGDQVEGWPLLLVYLFGVWGVLIGLLALHAERSAKKPAGGESSPPAAH